MEFGFNFYGDFELVANNDATVETLQFKTNSKTNNGADIRVSGAYAALSASVLALASSLMF